MGYPRPEHCLNLPIGYLIYLWDILWDILIYLQKLSKNSNWFEVMKNFLNNFFSKCLQHCMSHTFDIFVVCANTKINILLFVTTLDGGGALGFLSLTGDVATLFPFRSLANLTGAGDKEVIVSYARIIVQWLGPLPRLLKPEIALQLSNLPRAQPLSYLLSRVGFSSYCIGHDELEGLLSLACHECVHHL